MRRGPHEPAVVAEKEAFITGLKDLIEKLQGQVGQYRHARFGLQHDDV